MLTISVEDDIAACRNLWDMYIRPRQVTDLWEIRDCFHRNFQRKPCFVVARENDQVAGLVPLSYIPEENYYGLFPGEVWQGKTWIEQNQIYVRDHAVFQRILDWLDESGLHYHLRYLIRDNAHLQQKLDEDEIGYLFYPKEVGHSMDRFYEAFSRKSIKSILKDVNRMYEQNLTIRKDKLEDFDLMVEMNIERFGTDSYFASNRFVKSFREMRDFLHKQGWLKMTTILINGRPAAVDMGSLYEGAYVLLAGGTHVNYPGVAKVINLHHMKEACSNGYREVDFLCGDFSWKRIFHLTPRPLYQLTNIPDLIRPQEPLSVKEAVPTPYV